MESDSQGDVLMRRKVQNAILLQRQRDEAARVAYNNFNSNKHHHHQQQGESLMNSGGGSSHHYDQSQATTPVRHSAPGSSPSYVISPLGGGASVDFSYPQQPSSFQHQQHQQQTAAYRQRLSSPNSPPHHSATPHRSGYVTSQSGKLMDDHMDSPPPFQHPSSPPSRRVFPLVGEAERQAVPLRESSPKTSSRKQHPTQADIAAVREECQKQISILTSTVAERTTLLEEKEERIQQLVHELERQQQAQSDAVRSAVLGALEEASGRIRREGFIGLDRLRHEVANAAPDSLLDFPRSSSTGRNDQKQPSRNSGIIPGETEEERLHRALVQSVRQRYLARLQQ